MTEKTEKYDINDVDIRCAKKEDMLAVAEMIQELADFEKMPDGPKMSVKDLVNDGFERQPPAFQCKVAELRQAAAQNPVVGYALYFPTYSTWEGRSMMLEDLYVRHNQRRKGVGEMLFKAVAKILQHHRPSFPRGIRWEGRSMMLEDLYVRHNQRRKGVGEMLFKAVAKEASTTGCSRLDFHVLDWNKAKDFYEGKGAINLTNCLVYVES